MAFQDAMPDRQNTPNKIAEVEDVFRLSEDDPHLRMARLMVRDFERKMEAKAKRPCVEENPGAQEKQALALFDAGLSAARIATEMHLDEFDVRRLLRGLGVEFPCPVEEKRSQTIRSAVQAYLSGEGSQPVIAGRYGIAVTTLKKYVALERKASA